MSEQRTRRAVAKLIISRPGQSGHAPPIRSFIRRTRIQPDTAGRLGLLDYEHEGRLLSVLEV